MRKMILLCTAKSFLYCRVRLGRQPIPVRCARPGSAGPADSVVVPLRAKPIHDMHRRRAGGLPRRSVVLGSGGSIYSSSLRAAHASRSGLPTAAPMRRASGHPPAVTMKRSSYRCEERPAVAMKRSSYTARSSRRYTAVTMKRSCPNSTAAYRFAEGKIKRHRCSERYKKRDTAALRYTAAVNISHTTAVKRSSYR